MKIIVLADTHMPRMSKKLPEALRSGLKGAGLIIHAGDWRTADLYYELQQYGRVEGVSGNVDGPDIKQLVPEKKLLIIEGFKIGIVHGHGKRLTTEKRALAAFDGEKPDVIVFGHSHIPSLSYTDETLLFNPGSPTDKRRQPRYSYGVITIGEELKAEHIFFDSKE
ncbi:YfcE family phosphodiesterase [Bacillus sp. M6-12]|uniref:metallophosphoesterase family protein n=1 Tax=Bacillus sp. M6-12 TaxID=2054166 RepID=UPI000C782616|nr:metallophosphoesterase family protein [Bacillus sp. M6-12]PLS14665.1 YfcE family phosphodiesterase [Bacillus sp. M6-12]